MIVLQSSDRGCIYDIATTLQVCQIEYVIWNPNKISIHEMYEQMNPDLLIITEDFGRRNFDEIVSAKESIKNSGKLCILNMAFTGTEMVGYKWPASVNLVSSLNVPEDKQYQTDVSIIVEKEDSEDFKEIILEIEKKIPLGYTCKIYDSFNHYACVGSATQLDYPMICKNSRWVIDLRGEHGYNALLYGNNCHTNDTFLNVDNLIEDIINNNMPEYPELLDNFTNTRLILSRVGMQELANKVSYEGLKFYEKYWGADKRAWKQRLNRSCGGI